MRDSLGRTVTYMQDKFFYSDSKRGKSISKEEVSQSVKDFLASGREIEKVDHTKIKMLVRSNWESKKNVAERF